MRGISKQDGFSVLWAVLVILVVLAVGCAGWIVYQRNSANTTGTKTNTNHTQQPTPTPSAQANTFRIAELGIKLTVPNGLRDLKYAVDTTTVAGTTFVRFTTTTLEAKDGADSQCTAEQSALGVMWKTISNPASSGAAATASKQVGDAYILYNRPQQGCSNVPSTTQLQSSQAKLLEDAVQTAKAI